MSESLRVLKKFIEEFKTEKMAYKGIQDLIEEIEKDGLMYRRKRIKGSLKYGWILLHEQL